MPTARFDASAPHPRAARWPVVALALALLGASFWGAWRQSGALAAVETARTLTPAASQWTTGPGASLDLGAVTAPVDGVVRVEACGRDRAPEGVRVSVRVGGGALTTAPLTDEGSFSPRCVTAHRRVARGGRAAVSLTAASPASITEVVLRAGGALGPRAAWPTLSLIAALALIVFAPTLLRRRPPSPEVADDAAPYREVPREEPFEPPPPVPLALRWNPLVIVALALFVPQVAAVLASLAVHGGAQRVLAGLAAQHVAMVALSAWLLGAFSRDGFEAAGFGPVAPRWLGRAVVCAAGLVVFAAAVSAGLDVRDSPLARELARAPMRAVIAWASLGAPLSEEMLYRGAIYASFSRRGPQAAALAQAAIFTAMHAMQLQGALLGLAPIAAVGLVNGWLRWRTNGLVAPWLVHTLYNGALVASVIASP
ncbi:MAG: type II CAAX endopeptidase family protein [Polyangiales bacterium]